jgi:hypothetical protein
VKALVLALVLAFSAQAQSFFRNSITFSGGQARSLHTSCCESDTAVSLGATYGYRFSRYLQVEGGITSAIHPSPNIRGTNCGIDPNDLYLWTHLGLRGILPIWCDRIELSAAAGGMYEAYSASNSRSQLPILTFEISEVALPKVKRMAV